MKGKFMIIAALLGALTFGACVDSEESASVTAVRNAKAEQLKSVATLNNAKAQAEATLAAAEAALKQAEATLIAAEAAAVNAATEEQKIANQLAAAQAQAEIAALEAQLAIDLQKMELELIKAQAALKNEQDAQFQNLFLTYTNALQSMYEAQYALTLANNRLSAAENNLATTEILFELTLATMEAEIAEAEEDMAAAEAELEILREAAIGGITIAEANAIKAELQKEYDAANFEYQVAFEKAVRAGEALTAVDTAIDNANSGYTKTAYYKAYADFLTANAKLDNGKAWDNNKDITLAGTSIKALLNASLTAGEKKLDTNGDNTADTDFWGFYPKKWNVVDGDDVGSDNDDLEDGACADDADAFVKVAYSQTKTTKGVDLANKLEGQSGYKSADKVYDKYIHWFEYAGDKVASAYKTAAKAHVEKVYGPVKAQAEANVKAAKAAFVDADNKSTFEATEKQIAAYEKEIKNLNSLIAAQMDLVAEYQYKKQAFWGIYTADEKHAIEQKYIAAWGKLHSDDYTYNEVVYDGYLAALEGVEAAYDVLVEGTASAASLWKVYTDATKEKATIDAVYEKAIAQVDTAAAKLQAMEDNKAAWVEFTITAHNEAGEAYRVAKVAANTLMKSRDNIETEMVSYNTIIAAYNNDTNYANTIAARIDQLTAAIGYFDGYLPGVDADGLPNVDGSGYLGYIAQLEMFIATTTLDTFDEEWAIEAAKVAVAKAEAKLAYYEAVLEAAKAALEGYIDEE